MTSEKILPSVMVALSLGASLVYALHKDLRHALYWLASAVLIAAVTF